ncbi:cytochrome P450 714C2-like [Durio zibethinus]|uniref:Cytochrome P450 714C2-like n=1 Tax=Durio zibethinus TaxID=66656 RepID=A0A6P5ZK37_DURZI|nr:cytochrome P450 714C2-like [Durio zibethinus]
MDFYNVAIIFAGLGFWSLLVYLFHVLWLSGESRRLSLRRQGIDGPLPAFLWGNVPQMKQMLPAAPNQSSNEPIKEPLSQHCLMNLFPYFKQWTKQYGQSFLFALGRSQFLYVADAYFVREINCFTSLDMGKPAYLQKDRGALLGKGLITTNGAIWSYQRKTIAPHLFVDKVKDMLQLMVQSGGELVKSWENIVEANGGIADIRVDDYVRHFTSFIISNVMFGDEWQKGMEIFPKSLALINAMSTPTILSGIPFYRYFPTKTNREIWRLEKEIHSTIMDIVKKHAESASKDLLQVIIEGSKNGVLGPSTAEEFIVDNCKDICIPASEVTAVSATWGLMLLASHPEWQTRIRTEVLEVCNGGILNFDMLHKMKALRMVVLEVLRLYPATAFVSRQALQNVKLGHVEIPKGVNIWLWLLELHFDPKFWGPDAEKFNPERFANGISKACRSSQAYIPFGVGARVCPGQSLAMTELQVLFAIILSNFRLTISPNYRHSPQYALLIEPEFGVNVLVQKI